MLKCLGCNDPICEACRSHAFKGFGYRKHLGQTLCEHCYLDHASFEPVRCLDCHSTKIRGVCAENGTPSECAGCPEDEYSEDNDDEV